MLKNPFPKCDKYDRIRSGNSLRIHEEINVLREQGSYVGLSCYEDKNARP